MEPSDLLIAGALSMLAIDRVFAALKSRGIDLAKMARQTEELHGWHNVTDTDGVKIWYVRRSLEDALDKLSCNIELETKLLDRIDRRLERLEDRIVEPRHE